MFFGLLFVAHLCLSLTHLRSIEFFGEDEALTSCTSARIILGVLTGNVYNIAAPLSVSHPPLRYLVQLPFQAVLGVNELSTYLPHIIASLGIFYILLKIGTQFLKRSGLIFLAVLYVSGAAYAINRSPNGHGLFILFLLASFCLIDRYQRARDNGSRVSAWFLAALATLTYLEGVLFLPYLFLRSIPAKQRGSTSKEFRGVIVSILAYVLPLLGYVVVFLLLPLLVRQRPVGNLAHLLQRQGGVHFFRNNLSLFWRNYYYTFSPFMAALFAFGLVFTLIWIKRIPPMLVRLTAFFSLHILAWLFLFDKECGHTLYGYPVFLLCTAFALQEGYSLLRRWVARAVFVAAVACLALLSVSYCYLAYNDPNPRKEVFDFRNYLPCGVNYAHKVGLKSAAYLIRQNSSADDLFVGNTGGGMMFFLLGRRSVKAIPSFSDIVEQLGSNPTHDVYSDYSIRFVGVTTLLRSFSEECKLFNKHWHPIIEVWQQDGGVSFVVWDTQAPEGVTTQVIQVDQYDEAFDAEFSGIKERFPSWINYRPSDAPDAGDSR